MRLSPRRRSGGWRVVTARVTECHSKPVSRWRLLRKLASVVLRRRVRYLPVCVGALPSEGGVRFARSNRARPRTALRWHADSRDQAGASGTQVRWLSTMAMGHVPPLFAAPSRDQRLDGTPRSRRDGRTLFVLSNVADDLAVVLSGGGASASSAPA